MNRSVDRHLRHAGFSLVEMAIVLAIVAVLMAGLLPTISGQVEMHHIRETRKQLDEIQQALIGYAIINGRLPCPADGTIASGSSNAGMEVTTGSGSSLTCASSGGVLPWATLGISETDAWGRRFSYRVDTNFADAISANTYGSGCSPSITPTQSSFALCSDGNLNVRSAASGGTLIASNVPAIAISHGSNGYGAYTTAGQQISSSSNADESENSDNDNTFVSHDITPTFDDLSTWIAPGILLNRMVAAGKLP